MTLTFSRVPRSAPGLWSITLSDGSAGLTAPASRVLDLKSSADGVLVDAAQSVRWLGPIRVGRRLLVLVDGRPRVLPRITTLSRFRAMTGALNHDALWPGEAELLNDLERALGLAAFWEAFRAAVAPERSGAAIHRLAQVAVKRGALPHDLHRLLESPLVHPATYDHVVIHADDLLASWLARRPGTPPEHKLWLHLHRGVS